MKKKRFTEGTRVLAILSIAAAAACGGKIGFPIPDAYSDESSDSGATSSSKSADSRAPTSPMPDAGIPLAPQDNSLCEPIVSDVGCSVSFQRDILVKMLGATGTLHCAKAGCHDATGGVNPMIDPTQPALTYQNLYNAPSNIPYINPCSTDPTQSAILGNLAFPATQGSHMPQDDTTGSLPNSTDLATITTWVECGAPFN